MARAMLTPAQCRAARGFLNWTLADLAAASGLSRASLNAFEGEKANPKAETLGAIYYAFSQAGIEIDPLGAIRQKEQQLDVRRLHGANGIRELQRDIIATCRRTGSDILFNGIDEQKFGEVDAAQQHAQIVALREYGIRERVLLRQNDRFLTYPPDVTTYRWLDPALFGTLTSVTYGDCHAMIIWGPPIEIIITQSAVVAQSHRQQFEFLWALAQPLPFTDEEILAINAELLK